MAYKILIQKQANKKLLSLPIKIHHRIVEKIIQLGDNPDDVNKIVNIKIVKPRGDVYK